MIVLFYENDIKMALELQRELKEMYSNSILLKYLNWCPVSDIETEICYMTNLEWCSYDA